MASADAHPGAGLGYHRLMEFATVANVIVDVFAAQAIVGLALFAIVIGILAARSSAGITEAGSARMGGLPDEGRRLCRRCGGLLRSRGAFVRICEAIVGPTVEQVDE